MAAHAKLSPSSAHRWMVCPASLALESECPNTSSKFADEGTAAHFLASECLENKVTPESHIGRQIVVNQGNTFWLDEMIEDVPYGSSVFMIDRNMVEHVTTYTDAILDYAEGNQLMVEERVEFSDTIGVPNSFGTSDAVIVTADYEEIQVHDLKYGMGVEVDAFYHQTDKVLPNHQMALYALGAIAKFSLVGDFKRVRLVIHQPRRSHLSEIVFDLADIVLFGEEAKAAALNATESLDTYQTLGTHDALIFSPGEKQCHFCKAKATCPALRSHVIATVTDDFEDLTEPLKPKVIKGIDLIKSSDNSRLATCRDAVDLIEDWCSAIRAKTESELLQGRVVGDYKLVAGRKGARAWSDALEVESTLKSMRLKTEQMYDLKLISPTKAEDLHKAEVLGARQWTKIQAFITQADGKPTVAPGSDKRPALVIAPIADEFEDESLAELV